MTNTYKDYATDVLKTSQREKAVKGQKKNNAGGFVFVVDKFTFLNRFLILGTEGGTFYVGETKLTKENAKNVMKCYKSDYKRTVDMIVEVSLGGLAYKNEQAIFALALGTTTGRQEVTRYAMDALTKVCRTGTHLFHFVDYIKELRGFGRAIRRGIASWYLDRKPDSLAFQAVKYRQRDGWTHQDVLRLVHDTSSASKEHSIILDWIVGKETSSLLPSNIVAYEMLRSAQTVKEVLYVIENYRVTMEFIPTQFQSDPDVLRAVIPNLGLTAILRGLGKFTARGVMDGETRKSIVERLIDPEQLKRARIHPFAAVLAQIMYRSGSGRSLSWIPNQYLLGVLEDVIELSYGNVIPSGKRRFIGIDCSGSMWGYAVAGLPLYAGDAAAIIALILMKTEPENVTVMCFSSGGSMQPIPVSHKSTISEVQYAMRGMNWGGTDCALPMIHASKNSMPIDSFEILTDNETWAGNIHPCQALKNYRDSSGINSKLIVCAMTPTKFSIADPKDPLTLDIAGMDASVPQLITNFVAS